MPTGRLITTYDEAIAFLDDRIGQGVKPGLDRISGLLELMTDPHRSYRIVHVAGTNGKTTSARMITGLLDAHGILTGTFTSPHLAVIEERFSIAGRNLERDAFIAAVADVAPFVEIYEDRAGEGITYFELTAAIAFQAFASAGVEVAVIEVGLGGRLDATNVVEADVSVITGIALDHQEYLGSTLGEIAGEKAAILKTDGLLVTGPLPAAAEGAITARVTETGSKWFRFAADFGVDVPMKAVGGWQADFRGVHGKYADVVVPLHGRHQLDHFSTSLVACESLFGQSLDAELVRAAAQNLRSPGRIQVVGRSPLVVVDGSHNIEGIEGLATALGDEFPDVPWTLVFGARGKRDVEAMLEPLVGLVAEVVATEPNDPAAIGAAGIVEAARNVFGPDVEIRTVIPVSAAVDEAVRSAAGTGAVAVAGSLYVAGEALEHTRQQTTDNRSQTTDDGRRTTDPES